MTLALDQLLESDLDLATVPSLVVQLRQHPADWGTPAAAPSGAVMNSLVLPA